jgi:hypothetical protein
MPTNKDEGQPMTEAVTPLAPRAISLRDALAYLDVNRNWFNREVRPYVTEFRYGPQSVRFDRLELDAWFDEYKSRNGRPGQPIPKGDQLWDAKERQVSSNEEKSGISTKSSVSANSGCTFVERLAAERSKRQKKS